MFFFFLFFCSFLLFVFTCFFQFSIGVRSFVRSLFFFSACFCIGLMTGTRTSRACPVWRTRCIRRRSRRSRRARHIHTRTRHIRHRHRRRLLEGLSTTERALAKPQYPTIDPTNNFSVPFLCLFSLGRSHLYSLFPSTLFLTAPPNPLDKDPRSAARGAWVVGYCIVYHDLDRIKAPNPRKRQLYWQLM